MNRGLDWMEQAACAERPGLPWTADPDTYPDLLAHLMAETCATCPVHATCNAYAVDSASGGFRAGRCRDTDTPNDANGDCGGEAPGEVEEQPTLPFEDAAA